jgi:hypothetical protein
LTLLLGAGAPCVAAPPADEAPKVVLKSGQVLTGKVIENLTVQGTPMWKVATDFGELLVPRGAVARKEDGKPAGEDATFLAREVRVVDVKGDVQRRAAPDAPWEKVTLDDPYAKEPKPNTANSLVAPGDTVKTGPDGHIDLMLHKDVWVRIRAGSEVEIAKKRSPATLALLKGDVVQKIEGRPRGEVYRVQTPTTLLGVRGTFFRVTADTDERVEVAEGVVGIGSGPEVQAGQLAVRAADGTWSLSGRPAGPGALDFVPVRFPLDRMALVPAGTYSLGGRGAVNDELKDVVYPSSVPADFSHYETFQADVDAYLIDCTEVVLAAVTGWRSLRATAPAAPGVVPLEEARLPVEAVSWTEACAVARWLGKQLPSEVQWEVAARGPKALTWPWGKRVEAAHRALPILLFGNDERWSPGHSPILPVDADTVDVSPFGVRRLCSDPPEWGREAFDNPVIRAHPMEGGMTFGGGGLTDDHRVIRGGLGSTRFRSMGQRASVAASFRCVVELGPVR